MSISNKYHQQRRERCQKEDGWVKIEYQQMLTGLHNLMKQRSTWQFLAFSMAGILVYKLYDILVKVSETFRIGGAKNPEGKFELTNIPELYIIASLAVITLVVGAIVYFTDMFLAEKQSKLEKRVVDIEKTYIPKKFPTGFSDALQGKTIKGITFRFLTVTRCIVLCVYVLILVFFTVLASRHYGVTKAPKGVILKKEGLQIPSPKVDTQTREEIEEMRKNLFKEKRKEK